MRLMEALRLRIQDIDFGKNEITVHCGKGAKDRKTVLPVSLKFPLQKHLENVRRIHEADCMKKSIIVQTLNSLKCSLSCRF